MRIGLFTDTYHPSVNGIVFVVESLKKNLEAQGHEVFIFCPASGIRPRKQARLYEEDHGKVIRFASVKGVFYDDYDTSLFFPPRVYAKVKDLQLDAIHFFTPGQVGLLGVYAGFKGNIPVIAQHSTDLRQYVEHYSDGMLVAGLLALTTLFPFAVKLDGKDRREILGLYRPRPSAVDWNVDIVERLLSIIYSKCDAVIALSRKSKVQLESWRKPGVRTYDVKLLPSGVDPLPARSPEQLEAFKERFGIGPEDEVVGFVGRIAAEKNLKLIVDSFDAVYKARPNVKILFVGDFEYRPVLEYLTQDTCAPERFIFTGSLPRETLADAYGAMSVFAFPSMTDTQGWAVHEAALSGLPLLLVDRDLSEVIIPGRSGLYADDSPESFAKQLIWLLSHDKKRHQFGARSRQLAERFTEKEYIQRVIALYEEAVATHEPVKTAKLKRFRRSKSE